MFYYYYYYFFTYMATVTPPLKNKMTPQWNFWYNILSHKQHSGICCATYLAQVHLGFLDPLGKSQKEPHGLRRILL